MKRIKKKFFLIPAAFGVLAAICACLLFGAEHTGTAADIQTAKDGTNSPTAESSRSGSLSVREKENMDTEPSAKPANKTAKDGSAEEENPEMEEERQNPTAPEDITIGTQSQQGFLNDNTLHSATGGYPLQQLYPRNL